MGRAKFFKLEYEWVRSQRSLIATAHGRLENGVSLRLDLSEVEMFFGVCICEHCTEDVNFVSDYIQQHLNIKITRIVRAVAGEYMDVLEEDVGIYYLMYVEDPRRSLSMVAKFSETDTFMRNNVYIYETEFHLSTRVLIESKFEINRWYNIEFKDETLTPIKMDVDSLERALIPIKDEDTEDDTEIFTRMAIAVRFSDPQKTHFECLSAVTKTAGEGEWIKEVFVLRPSPIPLGDANVRLFETEESMVCGFLEYLSGADIDILLHHRGASEIFPALLAKIDEKKARELAKWQVHTVINKGMTKHNISELGRIHIDLVRMEQERVKARDMDLDDLSVKYLGEHHYSIASDESVVHACLKDALKVWKIVHEAALVTEVIQTSALVHMDPQRFVNTSQEAKTASLIQYFGKTLYPHRLLKISVGARQRRLVDWDEGCTFNSSSSTYTGGWILDSVPGLYDHWVVQWDFEGQYPSNMIAHNLSTDTILTKRIIERRNLVEGFDFVRMETSRTGTIPVAKKCIKEGILVKVQKVLKKRRTSLKTQMKHHDPKSMEWKILDIKQRTVKVLMNSLYGFLGDRTCIFYVESLADIIATCGRKCLGVARDVVSAMPDVGGIVMGNTDSIAATISPKLTFEKVVQLAWRLASIITTTINIDPIRIQPESIWSKIYIPNKKNAYGGRKIPIPPLSAESISSSIQESSLECTNIWNRSMCPFICDSLCDVMDALTNESEVSVRLKVENAFGRMVARLTAKSVPFPDLIFKGKINQDLSHYGAPREEIDAEGFTKIKMASDIPVTLAMKRKRKEVGDGILTTGVGAMMSYVAIVEPPSLSSSGRGRDVTGYCEAGEAWVMRYPIDWNEYRRKLEQAICTQLGDALTLVCPDIPPRQQVHDLLKSSVHIICQREIKSKRLQSAFPCLSCRKPVFPQFSNSDKPGFCPACPPLIEKIIKMDSEMKHQLEDCFEECKKCIGDLKCIEECLNVICPVYHQRQSAKGLRERFSQFYKNCDKCGKLSGVPRGSEREVRCC